jgi:hypothetical protein
MLYFDTHTQHPYSLETDLKFYREYCNKERVLSEERVDQSEEDEEEPDASSEVCVLFNSFN